MASHDIMAGKFHVYLRDTSPVWQCATFLKGRNHRISTKEEGLEQAKQVAEEWYLGLRGKEKAGILLNEKTFKFAAERFTMEYGLITEGQRAQKWTEGHAIRLRLHLIPFFGNIGLSQITPGKALAGALQFVEVRFFGQAYLEALVLAILLGVAIRTAWTPGASWHPGIAFSAKILLEIAVVLLGVSVSARTVLALGPALLGCIVLVVAVAIATSYCISRHLGLKRRMAILVACGNSICGNSATAAVAPVIGADGDEIASSIAFTAVLGVIVVLLLPLPVPVLALSLTQYGVLAGLTVYAVPQVLAATLPIGALSNQVGTVGAEDN